MKINDAIEKIRPILAKPIFNLLEDPTDKGNFGKALELLIGLKNSSKTLDFDDGELKTNDFYLESNKSKETIKVRQYSSNNIHEIIDGPVDFKSSPVYEKLRNTLYVTTIRYLKSGKMLNKDEWHFGHVFHINEINHPLTFRVLEADYTFCCKALRAYTDKKHVNLNKSNKEIIPFHTISGHFLQMRTAGQKDKSGTYRPIMIDKNFMLCNKPICFMLKTNFLSEVGIKKNII